jgi:hypothetical protein
VRAEPVLELTAGFAVPVSDDDWTTVAEPSPVFAVGIGAARSDGLAGMLRIGFSPVALDNEGGAFGGIASADISGQRIRVLGEIGLRRRIAPKVVAGFRAGAGIDLARASAEVMVLGSTTTSSDSDLGFGFEIAGGVWFDVGGAHVGAELAFPFAFHNKRGNNTDGNFTFDYTAADVAIVVGVRLGAW